ncbi:hypothetical protein [Rubrimonas cliftonensis]|uniref:Relaxasome subunit MobC n=1 Tax=Rubrimonas cliftonensis TaxID=89524 RepID=A0A1H4FXS8_9RHOB|nr:hypothetical protein [Rubrimonas cliftonensis]SEB02156.1 relaxasome subunit MobC [Rubrimonas cliftonensis]
MPRRSSEKQIQHLKSKIERLQAEAREHERKRATREKIVLGAAVKKLIEASSQHGQRLLRDLDGYITRDCDRDLVGLPIRKAPAPSPLSSQMTDDALDDFIR